MNKEKLIEILNKRTSINSQTDCWEYLGTNSDGYGQITIDYTFYYTHQLSAILFLNYDQTSEFIVCHKPICKSKACWNPEHLYVGTYADNNMDILDAGNARGRYSGVTHCVNGHEFTPENTYVSNRSSLDDTQRRQCRECRKINDIKSKAKKKGKT